MGGYMKVSSRCDLCLQRSPFRQRSTKLKGFVLLYYTYIGVIIALCPNLLTTFRDYVVRHPQYWHKYCHELRVLIAVRMRAVLGEYPSTCGTITSFGSPT
jgi:hypothetical protein